MAIHKNIDFSDDEEFPYLSDVEDRYVNDNDAYHYNNNNNNDDNVVVNNKEEDVQNQEIDDEYEPREGIDYFDDEEENVVTSLEEFGKFGEIDILQGFSTNLEDEFINGLINFDDFEYDFEFVDDDQKAKEKDLNGVVSDFADKFGKTNSTNISKMNKKRKISGIRDFPNGIGKKTNTVRGFSDEGNVVVLALQAPQLCPWRDSKGCLKKGRSRVCRRVN